MLDLLIRFKPVIKSYHISLYEQEGEILRFKAQLTFINDSKLFIKEYLFENKERKYAYHWQEVNGQLRARWDNSPHHRHITTFPHHKHETGGITASYERNLRDILEVIRQTHSP